MLWVMPIFQEMDQDLAAKLIDGYENILAPETKKMEAFYQQVPCPQCGGSCEKVFLSQQHAFGGDALVPRYGLKCTKCSCTFDPHSSGNIIVNVGEAPGLVDHIEAGRPK